MIEKSLDQLIKEINKESGEIVIDYGIPKKTIERIPFSSPRVNYMLYGGIPRNKMIEFAGPAWGGKTTSAIDICTNYLELPDAKKVLYVDYEGGFDELWAKTLGLDVSKIVLYQPDAISAEKLFDTITNMIKTDEIGLFVLDSVAALVPKQIQGKSMEDSQQIGGIAKSLTRFCSEVIPLLRKHQCTAIMINQVRDDMNSMYNLYTTPGGQAFKHSCACRLIFTQGELFDENHVAKPKSFANPAGNIVNVAIKKIRGCRPDRKNGFYTLDYKDGILYIEDTIDSAIEVNLIQQAGAWCSIIDLDTGEVIEKVPGRKGVVKYCKDHPDYFEQLSIKLAKEINNESAAGQ